MSLFFYINTIMTAFTRNPANPNFLQPNKFILNFTRAPALRYFCQTVTVPGIATTEVPQTNPFVELYVPGEKPVYDVLNITFMVDEKLESWREIHDWIRALTFPKEFEEYQRLGTLNKFTAKSAVKKPQYSDASVVILSSSNTPYYRFTFHDMFPVSISTFVMSATDDPSTTVSADATFRYSYYDIEKLY